MHLRSITLKGFKSFPDRTRLDFAPGVSVIVGPNGSGKSNITDAVLWALGEQSPVAVRGQTMQDVIFSGASGRSSRSAAEVEVVIDNADGAIPAEFSELSITRRLGRSGEGEYRVNGARCRLVDVVEVLSDTGLGKEMHSVVSQGRVEAIVHSRPSDRRALIEEAAGLGKHRKRRRRAELKLQRTSDNLARALDIEREARAHLRPLKRQAEAADLHTRLERQQLQARLELARDDARGTGAALASAEREAASARSEREAVERRLDEVARRRQAAEEELTARSRMREQLAGRLFASATALDRIDVRRERIADAAASAERLVARAGAQLEAVEAALESTGRSGSAPTEAAAGAAQAADDAGAALRRLRDQLGDAGPAATQELEALEGSLEAVARAVAQVRAALAAGAGEIAERARLEAARRREELEARAGALSTRLSAARELASACERAGAALTAAFDAVSGTRADLLRERRQSEEAAEPGAALRELAHEEAELQSALRAAGEAVTRAEVAAQQARDQDGDVSTTLNELAERLGLEAAPAREALEPDERERVEAAVARLARRREQLGPVNPLAGAEYEAALERVEELARQRADLEAALSELEGVIRDADRKIREDFDATFEAAASNFEEVVAELFPGGRGRLRLVKPDGPRPVIAGEVAEAEPAAEDADDERDEPAELEPGVEVEVTPAGKSMRRLSLLSGGEKSLVALGFLFAVFLARPCPFYILDEVEAALDDRNIDRFLALVRRCSRRAQFIVVTHQKRTMDAADRIYGVSMGGDGVSKVVSRRLRGAPEPLALTDAEEAAA